MKFFIGLHHPGTAWPFRRSMLSVVSLVERKRPIRVNQWILDSGAFSQISRYGTYVIGPDQYLRKIESWAKCGQLLGATCQDWMCEAFILAKTGLSVAEHQARTIESYLWLSERTPVYVLPVLQGFTPLDYVEHLRQYGSLLAPGQWVGVGSVCKRNGNAEAIEDVLLAIKRQRPDLALHGFGLKLGALGSETVRSLLASADSLAWSLANRFERGNANDPRRALEYTAKVESLIGGESSFVQEQLFEWWHEENKESEILG